MTLKQREVSDDDGLRWTCAQAYAGVETATAEAAGRDPDGDVDVVCTPSGASGTVRIRVASDWAEWPDERLVERIAAAREG